jgi:two-component system cell cycle sensor histidine kinase PleC
MRNKNLIKISFVIVLFGLIIHTFYYRYFLIKDLIINKIAIENQQTAQIYSKIIWNNNFSAVKLLQKHNYREFISNDVLSKFIKNSLEFFSIIQTEQVKLYNRSCTECLSSNNKHISNNLNKNFSPYNLLHFFDKYFYKEWNKEANNVQDAILKGESSLRVVNDIIITDKNGLVSKKSVIKTYFPIYTDNNFIADGVIEIITDVTKELDYIDNISLNYSIIFILLLVIFFIIITYIQHKVQKTVNKQIQISRNLKELKIQSEDENSAKIEFLANISHELRTPLNSIIGFSEIILNDKEHNAKLSEKSYDYINDIHNSGKQLLSIINDILDFSKAFSNKLRIENSEIDLNKICNYIIRFMQPKADEYKIEIIAILPSPNIIIKADPKRLKQALLNILSNSIKFTPKGGKIIIEAKINSSHDEVIIEISDNGVGIKEKDIPKALSVFHQLDNDLNREYEGTGLGLPLTKKLVELMGGKFELSSKENLGTKVTMIFKYKN